jgi:hypothetical protein
MEQITSIPYTFRELINTARSSFGPGDSDKEREEYGVGAEDFSGN